MLVGISYGIFFNEYCGVVIVIIRYCKTRTIRTPTINPIPIVVAIPSAAKISPSTRRMPKIGRQLYRRHICCEVICIAWCRVTNQPPTAVAIFAYIFKSGTEIAWTVDVAFDADGRDEE